MVKDNDYGLIEDLQNAESLQECYSKIEDYTGESLEEGYIDDYVNLLREQHELSVSTFELREVGNILRETAPGVSGDEIWRELTHGGQARRSVEHGTDDGSVTPDGSLRFGDEYEVPETGREPQTKTREAV